MSFGFIITRHVNSEKTNKYWNHNVKLLRTHYPNNKIIIIDDNSNQDYIKADFEYKNVEIIKSEYPGRGELLPYIYYLNNKWFDNAIIIHDSVFFHKTINFEKYNCKVISLWFFHNNDSELDNIIRIARHLNYNQLIYQNIIQWKKQKWFSCFGAQSYINHDFLVSLNNKYKLTNLINVVKNRNDRCALERIFGILFYIETNSRNSLFGIINNLNSRSANYDYSFEEYISLFNKKNILSPIVKVWTGR
jgi:hypothetical protein